MTVFDKLGYEEANSILCQFAHLLGDPLPDLTVTLVPVHQGRQTKCLEELRRTKSLHHLAFSWCQPMSMQPGVPQERVLW